MFDVNAEGRPEWRALVERLAQLQLLYQRDHPDEVIDITDSNINTEPKKESHHAEHH